MKLAWLSDLHLDFVWKDQIFNLGDKIYNADCDAAIISGDIATSRSCCFALDFLQQTARKPIYYVLGNHDYYDGSIKTVNFFMEEYSETSKFAKWASIQGVIGLTKNSCLIGVEGWYDARYGNFLGESFNLNDFELIHEIKQARTREAKGKVFRKLADASAEYINSVFCIAAEKYKNILILTHVPPFAEVCLYEGQPSSSASLPLFSSRVMGETLLDLKEKFIDKNIEVFCGHTHSPAELTIDNLRVSVAGAIYGQPDIYTIVDVE